MGGGNQQRRSRKREDKNTTLTLATVCREGDDDLVPDLELGHVPADLDDLADDLVAESRAWLEREVSAIEVEVGA